MAKMYVAGFDSLFVVEDADELSDHLNKKDLASPSKKYVSKKEQRKCNPSGKLLPFYTMYHSPF